MSEGYVLLAAGKCCSHRHVHMHGDSKYNCWVQPDFAWHAADELSQLEQAKLVWGHHVTLRWLLHFTSVLIFWAATTNPLDVQLESEVQFGASTPARFDSEIKQVTQLALLRDQAQQVNRHTFLCSGSPPWKSTVTRLTCR